MTDFLSGLSHRRRNILTGDWVTVSPNRSNRPWQGDVSRNDMGGSRLTHDPGCYLCPGNKRANGRQNPDYKSPWVFENDFPAVVPPISVSANHQGDAFFQSQPVSGACRVMCYTPQHDLSLASLNIVEIGQVVGVWVEQVAELRQKYIWVQVFENKGTMMGCSSPHPHGQVWAVDHLPSEPAREDERQAIYYKVRGRNLLEDYLFREEENRERVVLVHSHWAVLVPYWAVWPFETILLPRRRVDHLDQLTVEEQQDLAAIMKRLLIVYDRLFGVSCPYSMGWHGAPGLNQSSHWQLHAHWYPPLLRSASIRKHMVGYEMLAESQRDLTPEWAAARLREIVYAVG